MAITEITVEWRQINKGRAKKTWEGKMPPILKSRLSFSWADSQTQQKMSKLSKCKIYYFSRDITDKVFKKSPYVKALLTFTLNPLRSSSLPAQQKINLTDWVTFSFANGKLFKKKKSKLAHMFELKT